MQTSKKRIMGALGLASVAAMTVAAYNVPAPAAYANTNQSVPLKVTVQAENVYTQITGDIRDGTQTAISPAEIQVIFSHASRLDYAVSIFQGEITVDDIDTGSIDPSTIEGVTDQGDGYAGTYTASIDIKQLVADAGLNPNKAAGFTYEVTGWSASGEVSMGDAVTFDYGQVAINPDDNINPKAEEGETNVATAENGDPIITVETGDEVTRLHAIITGPDDSGVLFEQDVDVTSNLTNVTLAFAEHNAKSGWYTVTIQAYDVEGTLVGTSELRFYYAAPIGIPDTGGSIFAGLNISRADFLVSGLLVFGIAAVAGLLLMNRSKKSSKRARK